MQKCQLLRNTLLGWHVCSAYAIGMKFCFSKQNWYVTNPLLFYILLFTTFLCAQLTSYCLLCALHLSKPTTQITSFHLLPYCAKSAQVPWIIFTQYNYSALFTIFMADKQWKNWLLVGIDEGPKNNKNYENSKTKGEELAYSL